MHIKCLIVRCTQQPCSAYNIIVTDYSYRLCFSQLLVQLEMFQGTMLGKRKGERERKGARFEKREMMMIVYYETHDMD